MEYDNILKKYTLISISAFLLLALCLTAGCPDPHLPGGGGDIKIEDLQNNLDCEFLSESTSAGNVLSDDANYDSINVTYHSNDQHDIITSVSETLYGDYIVIKRSPIDLGWTDNNTLFLGWCEKPSGGTYIYSSGMYNVTSISPHLYAIWDPYYLTITFETFDGTTIAPVQLNYFDKLTLPDTPKRPNSTFIGWYLDKEFKIPYSSNDPVIDDFTLYAKWYTYSVDYQVRYDDNDATDGAAPITSYFESGDVFKIPGAGSLVKDGFTFAGWSYNDTVYQQGTSFRMPSKSIHFVAIWEKIPNYTVLFLVDDTQHSSAKVESGKLIEMPTPPMKDGYIFTHWSLNGVEYDFTSAVTSNLELVAEWEKVADPVADEKDDAKSKPNWFYTAIAIICIIVAILVYLLYKNKI